MPGSSISGSGRSARSGVAPGMNWIRSGQHEPASFGGRASAAYASPPSSRYEYAAVRCAPCDRSAAPFAITDTSMLSGVSASSSRRYARSSGLPQTCRALGDFERIEQRVVRQTARERGTFAASAYVSLSCAIRARSAIERGRKRRGAQMSQIREDRRQHAPVSSARPASGRP
jgi:hypothetical protein